MLLVFSYIIAIIFLVDYALAEYDCSAKDDGWYYDPEFCHIYWRCIHGTAEEFECASGTAWDHHANRCNWLDSIDCTRSEKTTAKSITDDDSSGDDGQYLTDGNSATVGENTDSGDIDNQPPTAVKRKKKKTKKNRKLDSNKRILDGEKTNGKDHREIAYHLIAFTNACFLSKQKLTE